MNLFLVLECLPEAMVVIVLCNLDYSLAQFSALDFYGYQRDNFSEL